MARLIYSAIMSLDGYTADADGRIEWAAPDEEVHAFVNELERPVGAYLYGRRMYETMRYWETAHTLADQSPASLDFARIWQAADKIVYSTTLQSADTARTRVERDFDPDQVRKLKEAASRDLTVGGPRGFPCSCTRPAGVPSSWPAWRLVRWPSPPAHNAAWRSQDGGAPAS
jgi:dihydrofolate reductase